MAEPLQTALEQRVVRELQEGIPLVHRPFRLIAERCGLDEHSLIGLISHLKETGIIRSISPIYDTKMLGYDTALVAFAVAPPRLESVAAVISCHKGVSHNYEREHSFNLWFTMAVPPNKGSVEQEVAGFTGLEGVEGSVVLRTRRTFKIGVRLDPSAKATAKEKTNRHTSRYVPLTDSERTFVRETQIELALCERPYALYAERLGLGEERVIEKLCEFKRRGVLRRVAAILRHRRAGFVVNAMSVWAVPQQKVEEVGSFIASFKGVSHCYERNIEGSGWRHNLLAMIHSKTAEDIQGVIEEIKKETGIYDCQILYTRREFKKERLRYFI